MTGMREGRGEQAGRKMTGPKPRCAYWALALLAGNVAVIKQDGNGRGGG